MGAAAVLETAAETPPTVIASQFLLSFVTKFPTAHNTSSSIEVDGGNEYAVSEGVDLLIKSITKGGLLEKLLAE
jgi:hypothetical protein